MSHTAAPPVRHAPSGQLEKSLPGVIDLLLHFDHSLGSQGRRLRGLARQNDPNHSLFGGLWDPGAR